ncbi:hypothetical protein WAX74_12190 [Psychrobacillus sp. FJAT-51614]|uniref:Nudix hydrolase domain-containing protein n=1 Tax=Psychrobacillus mangrovi TaxID=3117745 RepID=A0ABU8F8N9_9BACI
MMPIVIENTPTQVTVKFDSTSLILPSSIQVQHQLFWEKLLEKNPHFHNGDVFTITHINKTIDELEVTVVKTDYKHYLYTIHHPECAFPCKVIFTCVAVLTNDHHIAFGRMNQYSSTPGRLQFTGGGLDENDLDGLIFDLERSIGKELEEEMGLKIESSYSKSFKPKFVKNKGTYDFWAIMFELKVDYSMKELQALFQQHNESLLEKGEQPEFDEFLFVSLDKESVETFIQKDSSLKEDYLEPILLKYIEE